MIVIEMCNKHKVKLVGFNNPFCNFCKKDTEGNKTGKRMFNFNKTFLSSKIQGETIETYGDVVNSMIFIPEGAKEKITVSDILVGQEKVRITINEPSLMREFQTSKTVVVAGIVRHNMKHIDGPCDDLLITKLQDIS